MRERSLTHEKKEKMELRGRDDEDRCDEELQPCGRGRDVPFSAFVDVNR
jgi:hypothetical protein